MCFTAKQQLFLLALSSLSTTQAATWQNPIVQCRTFTHNGLSQEICAHTAGSTPSLATIPDANGTLITVLAGGYTTELFYLEGVPNGTDVSVATIPDTAYTHEIFVRREDDDITCSIKVNNVTCTTCGYCQNDLYTADCTNIDGGRVVEDCETDLLFYPLLAVEETTTTTPADNTPDATPSPAPTSAAAMTRTIFGGLLVSGMVGCLG